MLSLARSDPNGSEIASFPQIWRTPTRIMSIRGKNADTPLVQHSLGPISRISAKGASKRAGCNLHPDPRLLQALDGVIMGLNPRKPLRMGQDRHVAGDQEAEEELLQARRNNVVRRLYEDVARIA